MKEITAIIQPHTLSRVMQALHAFRFTENNFSFHDKMLLLVTCEAVLADSVVAAIAQAARPGNKGDGLVTVKDVARVICIRTGETAGHAL